MDGGVAYLQSLWHVPLSEAQPGLIASSFQLVLLLPDQVVHHLCVLAQRLRTAHTQSIHCSALQILGMSCDLGRIACCRHYGPE